MARWCCYRRARRGQDRLRARARARARADPDEVASPTFVLLTAYPGRLTLHHADLYRLRGDGDERELGLEELPGPGGVLAVEWAERLRDAPWRGALRVRLAHAGDDQRAIRIEEAA